MELIRRYLHMLHEETEHVDLADSQLMKVLAALADTVLLTVAATAPDKFCGHEERDGDEGNETPHLI